MYQLLSFIYFQTFYFSTEIWWIFTKTEFYTTCAWCLECVAITKMMKLMNLTLVCFQCKNINSYSILLPCWNFIHKFHYANYKHLTCTLKIRYINKKSSICQVGQHPKNNFSYEGLFKPKKCLPTPFTSR